MFFSTFILLLLFAGYVREAIKGEEFEADLVGPAALIDTEFKDGGRRLWAMLLFVFAGFAIFVSAVPFAESLVTVGRASDFDEFLLVQDDVSSLASESHAGLGVDPPTGGPPGAVTGVVPPASAVQNGASGNDRVGVLYNSPPRVAWPIATNIDTGAAESVVPSGTAAAARTLFHDLVHIPRQNAPEGLMDYWGPPMAVDHTMTAGERVLIPSKHIRIGRNK